MMDVVFALHWQCYMILRMDQNFKGCPVKPKLIDVDPSSNLYIFISGATKNDSTVTLIFVSTLNFCNVWYSHSYGPLPLISDV